LDPGGELPVAESVAGSVRLKRRCALLVGIALAVATSASGADTLVTPEDVARTLVIENLAAQDGRVAGVIVNQSDRTVRGVALQVLFSWLWADEHRQGTDDPSFVVTEVVHDEIPPHGNLTFGYSYPSATTTRRDGRFILDVRIVGFNTVGEARQTY
jgi:hypothetical protein